MSDAWVQLDAPSYSVALTDGIATELDHHLDREDGQEDICFVLWRPSTGLNRSSALVFAAILPEDGDRHVHGNASFESHYLLRATRIAAEQGAGLGLIHSHPHGIGWQRMSHDDHHAESSYAAQVLAITGLPFLGLTLGTGDNNMSARFWNRTAPREYQPLWCDSVRIVGSTLRVNFNNDLRPVPPRRASQQRTVAAWGEMAHRHLTQLRIGVVGAGSVGTQVAESLARSGVVEIVLIDFDTIKEHNLDRLLHAYPEDAQHHRAKVDVLADALKRSSTAAAPKIEPFDGSVVEEAGFRRALDCDLIFSCVDRPWARAALNLIAYAHLIPVVDGGIAVRSDGTRIWGAEWRSHVAAPGHRCLECLGQYDPALVQTERDGYLDDPSYLTQLPADSPLRQNQNVYAFSAACASDLVIQMLRMVIAPGGVSDVGASLFHFATGTIDLDLRPCNDNCIYTPGQIALGDLSGLHVTEPHLLAEQERRARATSASPSKVPEGFARLRETLGNLVGSLFHRRS